MIKLSILTLFSFILTSGVSQNNEMWGIGWSKYLDYNTLIYKVNQSGQYFTPVKYIYNNLGRQPGRIELLITSAGRVFGTTSYGGVYDKGCIFEYVDSTEDVIIQYSFVTGKYPVFGLTEASDGIIYGTTSSYAGYFGAIYAFNPLTNTVEFKHLFNDSITGSSPSGTMFLSSNGNLIGVTAEGGANDAGVLFEYNIITDSLSVLHNFVLAQGNYPVEVFIDSTDKVYGLTRFGGVNNEGTIYSFDLGTAHYNKLKDLDNSLGVNPRARFSWAQNNHLITTTFAGGNFGDGTLLVLNKINDSVNKVSDFFDFQSGEEPYGTLFMASNGIYYGLTSKGGDFGNGSIYSYDFDTGVHEVVHSFNSVIGDRPLGGLIEITPGILAGVCSKGGQSNEGTLFTWNYNSGEFNLKSHFKTALDGKDHSCKLSYGGNGKLYGLTRRGGIYDFGVLYSIDPINGHYEVLYNFDSGQNGGNPMGHMSLLTSGKFIFTTTEGGTYSKGTLNLFDPIDDSISTLHNFSFPDGEKPISFISIVDSVSVLGMSRFGGQHSGGTVWLYNIQDTAITVLHDFDWTDGAVPHSGLTKGINGLYYGLTQYGGLQGKGIVYSLDLSDSTINIIHHLNDSISGSRGFSRWSVVNDSILIAMTYSGGSSNTNKIISLNTNNDSIQLLIDFDSTALVMNAGQTFYRGNDGRFYATCALGQIQNHNYIFAYDYDNNDYELTATTTDRYHTFSDYHSLTGIENCSNTSYNILACDSFNYNNGLFYFDTTGNYTFFDTISNSCGGTNIVTYNLDLLESTSIYETLTSCDSLTWRDDSTYTVSTNAPQFIVGTPLLCDTNFTLDLIVNLSQFSADSILSCDPITYLDGNTYTQGIDSVPFTFYGGSVNGCDSTVYTNLIILDDSYGTDIQTACDAFTWIDGNTYLSNNNSSTYTIINGAANGCDSIVTLNLTFSSINLAVSGSTDTLISNADTNAQFQWLDCDNGYFPIINENNAVFLPQTDGSYAVEITQYNCIDTTLCFDVIGTWIDENAGIDISISPNPTEGVVKVNSSHQLDSYHLTNSFGILMDFKKNIDNHFIIDISGFSSGTYYLKIEGSNGESYFAKILKL